MSIISSSTTSTTAYKVTADTTGTLVLQTGSTPTTAVTIGTDQSVTFAGPTSVQGITVGRGAGSVATNTAVGASALAANSTGSGVTAIGTEALAVSTASNNTAVGYQAAYANTAADNTAIGTRAMLTNTTGTLNVAAGGSALRLNTTGSSNTALGVSALFSNTTASNNTAVGYQAGYSANRTADTNGFNTFLGWQAGYGVTTGQVNTLLGAGAGTSITTGSKNTVIGNYNGNQGGLDIRTASNYIVLSDGDGNPRMYINGSGTWFYATAPAGAGTNAVKYNSSTGALTYDTSSARYKDNIRDSVYGLSHVMQMRSTQFEYKDDGRSDVGLIAEELQPIIPELVGVNKEGQADSVSYDRIVSVLVKAIQELKAEFDAYKEAHP